MTPEQFEHHVACLYSDRGYQTYVSPLSNDWGIDVIAKKGDEKIAIQVKRYGGTTRKVNRRMIMELYGASAYQDCTSAVLATDGEVMPDARLVADKLGITILQVSSSGSVANVGPYHEVAPDSHVTASARSGNYPTFDEVWRDYIMPLSGKTVNNDGLTNIIKSVTWAGVVRETSTGATGNKIGIEGFRLAYESLIRKGEITREYINQQADGRCSSGIVLILGQIPFVETLSNPKRLKLMKL